MRHWQAGVLVMAMLAALAGCGDDDAQTGVEDVVAGSHISGTVSYRERIMLRPGALVEISLLDVSRADAPAQTLAAQVIMNPGAPPIPFELDYDPAQINEKMSYVVRATIKQDGALLMTTDTAYPVLTRGAGDHADLLLVGVGQGQSEAEAASPDVSLTNTYWKLVQIMDEPYVHDSDEREPHLKLNGDSGAVSGLTGCNSFRGSFSVSDTSLSFGQLAVTKKMCFKGMELEAQYVQALGSVTAFSIKGEMLQLFAGDVPVLVFKAVYF